MDKIKKISNHFLAALLVFSVYAWVLPTKVHAEVPYNLWGDDGVTIDTTTDNDQVNNHSIVSDGQGGAYVAWIRSFFTEDYTQVYVQRVNAAGVPLWADGGIPVSDSTDSQNNPVMTIDSSGNVIVAWSEYNEFNENFINIQKISTTGTLLWGDHAVPITNQTESKNNHRIITDDADGAIVAWNDYRDGAFADIYAQRISSDGNVMWNAAGLAVFTSMTGGAGWPYIVPDMGSGAIIAWSDGRVGNSNYDVYLQWIDKNGNEVLTSNGELVISESGGQGLFGLVGDYTGEYAQVIMIWDDERNGDFDIYGQKFDTESLNFQWDLDGVAISPIDAVSFSIINSVVSDGQGGVFVIWDDSDGGLIVGQRVNGLGELEWNANGVRLVSNSYPANLSIINTNDTDAIMVWDHYTNDEDENEIVKLHAQYIDSEGDTKWGPDGLSIYDGIPWNDVNKPLIVNDGDIGGIVAWRPEDIDTGNYYQMKVQRVSHAYQIANLIAGLDAEDDQGRNIELGTVNGLVGEDEVISVLDSQDNLIISDVETDMIEDHNWSNVLGDVNLGEGKSVITGLTSAPGANSLHNLYVPVLATDNDKLVVCPDATQLSEVTADCSNRVVFSEGDSKQVGSDTVTVSKVTVDSQQYWKAAGVSGTGGLSTTSSALGTLAATGVNLEATQFISIGLTLFGFGSLMFIVSQKFHNKYD